jgi:hypothetical protein
MLRDAKTTSIAERKHRPPLGSDTVSATKAVGMEQCLILTRQNGNAEETYMRTPQ